MGRPSEDRTHIQVTGRMLLGIIIFLRTFIFGLTFGKIEFGNEMATSSYVGVLKTLTRLGSAVQRSWLGRHSNYRKAKTSKGIVITFRCY